MANQPKWATPDRQAYLVKLWLEYGNRCLLGHKVCHNPQHYVYTEPKAYEVAIPIKLPSGLDSYKVKVIAIPEEHIARLYEYLSEQAIASWKYQDRLQRQAELRAWRLTIHRITSRNKPRCDFNADAFYDKQPIYYLEGLGISGLTFKPFAKVRLSSSYTCLLVELDSQIFKPLSKNKKRKALRYGKGLPEVIEHKISNLAWLAVKHYLKW